MESLLCLRRACATKALSSRACTCTKLYRCWHRRSASDWQKLSLMLILSMMIYNDIMYEKLTGTDGHLGGCSRNLEQRGVQSTKRQDLLEDTRADRIYRLFLESTAIQAHWIPLDPIGSHWNGGSKDMFIMWSSQSNLPPYSFPNRKHRVPSVHKRGGGVGATPLPAILEHSVRTGLAYRSGEFHPIYL